MAIKFDTRPRQNAGDKPLNWVRNISRNAATTAEILCQLAASLDQELKMAVADDLSTPEELLLLLAEDESADLRYAIAENHNIGRKVLSKLLDDPNPYVAHRAQTTLGRLSNDDSSHLS